jgi:hypothetical protein
MAKEIKTEEVAEKAKKVVTTEEVAGMVAAIEVLKEAGVVSEKFQQVLKLVPNWHDTEANKEVKKEVIESFGGSEEFKNYIDDEFQKELAAIAGFVKLGSTLNNIKSFYARRANKATKKSKVKTSIVNINGTSYNVSVELLAELKEDGTLSQSEKYERILNDANTTQVEVVDVL